jgi:hypothetical protein
MKLSFMINNNDDGRQVALMDLPAVPRIGETVSFYGPEFGEDNGHEEGEMLFTVLDVIWRPDDDGGDVEVWLEVHAATDPREPWRPFCKCPPEKQVYKATADGPSPHHEPGFCDNCGDPIRARRHNSPVAAEAADEEETDG